MKNKFVTIGLVQNSVSSNAEENIKKAEKMIRQAAKKGAQIICLAELFNTPYFPQWRNYNIDNYIETVPGRSTKVFSPLAKELGVVIIVPIFEKAKNGKNYNSAVVINSDGKILPTYHKLHIPHDPGFYERDYFEEGVGDYRVYKTKFATFAVLICFDQWFPEAARLARLGGAEIIFYPTAIGDIIGYKHPNDWHDAWETIQRSHAIANSVVVASVNRIGIEGRTKFWGQSFISDAWGKILKKAGDNTEQVVVQKVDLEYNKFLSEGWGFMRNRRPETYKDLTSNKLVKRTSKLANVEHYKAERKALGEEI